MTDSCLQRVASAVLVVAGALSLQGCVFFTTSLREYGMESEQPRCSSATRGPFLWGCTDAQRSRFLLCYVTDRDERWLSFRSAELLRWAEREAGKSNGSDRGASRQRFGASEGLVLSERATWRHLAAQPRWWDYGVLLDFCAVTSRSAPDDEKAVGVQFPAIETGLAEGERVADDKASKSRSARAWVRLRPADGGPGRWVALSVGPRIYRTVDGKAAQALLPLAVAADIVTWPVQALVPLVILSMIH